jgi:hypothetical protein
MVVSMSDEDSLRSAIRVMDEEVFRLRALNASQAAKMEEMRLLISKQRHEIKKLRDKCDDRDRRLAFQRVYSSVSAAPARQAAGNQKAVAAR